MILLLVKDQNIDGLNFRVSNLKKILKRAVISCGKANLKQS